MTSELGNGLDAEFLPPFPKNKPEHREGGRGSGGHTLCVGLLVLL